MTPRTSDPSLEDPGAARPLRRVQLRRRLHLSALGTLFGLTMRQHTRGLRLWVVAFLFALPVLAAVSARLVDPPAPAAQLEAVLIFMLFPHALVPLAALLYSSGMIRDEIEDQTLTYLLIRPLPRWSLYVTKLLATLLVTVLLTAVFTLATYAAIYAGTSSLGEVLANRAPKTALLLALALTAYCSLFGCISLFASRSLVIGVGYILLFEGWLANIDFAVRRLTVMYYFRTLSLRWLGLERPDWIIDLGSAPTAQACVLVLLGVGVVLALLAAFNFAGREFRLKTPEAS